MLPFGIFAFIVISFVLVGVGLHRVGKYVKPGTMKRINEPLGLLYVAGVLLGVVIGIGSQIK